MTIPRCDIVVPVHDALDATTDCLESVVAHTDGVPFRMIVVDDASHPFVAARLGAFAREEPRVLLLRNDENLGYLKSVNRGIAASTAPYVCLLNSDTIVTPGWLRRLIRCAESDPKIAIVNPLTNAAANLSVPIAPGLDVFGMAEAVAACSRRDYPDIVTAVGFCLLLTRATIERFGAFDEVYGHGYCEESDYCMRLMDAGLRVVAADDTFIFHRGSASFGVRGLERYFHNRAIFDTRWSKQYELAYAAFSSADPLAAIRAELTKGLAVTSSRASSVPPDSAPRDHGPFEKLWVMTQDAWHRGGALGFLRKAPLALPRLREATERALARSPASTAGVAPEIAAAATATAMSPHVTPEYIARLPRGSRGLRIAILVWRFEVCGGVLTLVDLANRLTLEGNTVMLVTVGEEPAPGTFALYGRPLVFPSAESLGAAFPDVDVVVATFWPTAADWLPRIRQARPKAHAVYFVQDYEPWFYPDDDGAGTRRRIVESYAHADARIVTTEWLRGKLASHGYTASVIPVGVDLRIFHPRARTESGQRKRVLVQARPHTPWRGFDDAVTVLTRLARRRRDVDAILFGCTNEDVADSRLDFPLRNEGIVHDRAAVARLVSSCDVLFDPSRFQAFGLPGLEAMACGTPAVLPDRGGIVQYAVNDVNALLVAPDDVDGRVAAIERLLDDEPLRSRLIAAGFETAARHSHDVMARQHLALYRKRVRADFPDT